MRKRELTPLPEGMSPYSPEVLIATGLGFGRMNPAPGTWGSVVAWGLATTITSLPLLAATLVGVCIAGWWAIPRFQKQSGTHDAGMIVIDEWAGVILALLFATPNDWPQLFLALFAFRFFDILKPWPISWLDQKVKGASGVMLDDLLAGLCAGLCVYGYGLWMH